MSNMTLQQMLEKVAMYTRREIGSSPYTGESLDIVNKITDGINYAYIKICKEKYKLIHKENVTLDSNLQFNTDSLSKTLFEIEKVTYDELPLKFHFVDDTTCYIPDGYQSGIYEVIYSYIPAELSNLTDKPVFPDGAIDNKIFCYYAAYHYLNIEIDSSAVTWLNLFNEAFSKIRQRKGASKQVKSIARW